MRNVIILMALAAIAAMLIGCPVATEEEGGTPSAGATRDVATGETLADQNGDGEEAGDDATPQHPLLDVELELVPSVFEVQEVSLGSGYEEYMLRHDEEANFQNMWVKEGVLGLTTKFNTQEDPMPTETAVFQDGSMVSFMWANNMDADAYAIALVDAVDAYGDYADDPAEWVQESAFFPDGYEKVEGVEASYWMDEDSRTMMAYIFDPEEEVSAQMVLYVDHHYAATEAAFEEMNRQMEAMIAEQMAQMQAEGGMQGMEGEIPFTVEEEPADVDEEIEAAEEEQAEEDAAANEEPEDDTEATEGH